MIKILVEEFITKEDYITSTHRPHGHAIAKGVSIKSMMAELYGKNEGCCKGYGGSMHVGSRKSRDMFFLAKERIKDEVGKFIDLFL